MKIPFKKEKKEMIYREISSEKEPKSRANRIRMLLKKNERIFKDKQAITDFKEPIAMLMRRSRAVEFYEDASKGVFAFTHSDGKYREIYLEPSYQVSFDYGKRKFKGYILHEDFPLPLPENPIVTSETMNAILEKSIMDMKRLNERKTEQTMKMVKLFAIIILGSVLLYFIYQAHFVEKLIGMVTGNPWIDPATIANNINNRVVEDVSSANILAITSS